MRLPDYDELPVTAGAPAGSSWGLWGDDDRFGCLNLLGPERVAAGMAAVRDHRVVNLNLELELPGPPLFGRSAHRHIVTDLAIGHDDALSDWNTQSSSQWDGFRHVRHPVHGFYGGLDDTDHGMHHWARRGIAGRAVLADVERWRRSVGRPLRYDIIDPIEPSELLDTLSAQGTTVETGDILLIRTGWLSWYRSLDGAGRAELAARAPKDVISNGLRPGNHLLRTLWNLHPAAVAADNTSVEQFPIGSGMAVEEAARKRADPVECADVFAHFSLLPLLGLPLGELWDLDELAELCASDRRYECLLVSAPLNLRDGVASPPNAVAIR